MTERESDNRPLSEAEEWLYSVVKEELPYNADRGDVAARTHRLTMERLAKLLFPMTVELTPEFIPVYVETLAETGKHALACEAVGTTARRVEAFIKSSPLGKLFEEACDRILMQRGASIVASIEKKSLDGYLEPMLDKNGKQVLVEPADGGPKVPGWKIKYPDGIRGQMLKRYDAAYREQSSIDVNVQSKTGVLCLPTPSNSIAEWQALAATAAVQKPEP